MFAQEDICCRRLHGLDDGDLFVLWVRVEWVWGPHPCLCVLIQVSQRWLRHNPTILAAGIFTHQNTWCWRPYLLLTGPSADFASRRVLSCGRSASWLLWPLLCPEPIATDGARAALAKRAAPSVALQVSRLGWTTRILLVLPVEATLLCNRRSWHMCSCCRWYDTDGYGMFHP